MKAFEMVHLHTYQSDFISTYSKAACQVDTQLALAQHAQREVRNRGHHNVAVASCWSLDFDCGILDNQRLEFIILMKLVLGNYFAGLTSFF